MNETTTQDRTQAPSGRTRIRFLRRLLVLLGGLLLLCAGIVAWLVATSSGTAWLLGRAELPEGLQLGPPEGSLVRGLAFHGIAWRDDAFQAEAAAMELRLGLDWRPWTLNVKTLRVEDLRLDLSTSEPSSEPVNLERLLAQASVPVAIRIEDAAVDGLRVSQAGGETLEFERVELSGLWFRSVQDALIRVRAPWLDGELSGDLALAAGRTDLDLEARVDASHWSHTLPRDLELAARVNGGFEEIPLDLRSESADFAAEGVLADLLESPRAMLDVRLGRWTTDDPAATPLTLSDISGRVEAGAKGYVLDLGGELDWDDLPTAQWRLDAAGEGDALRIAAFEARSDFIILEASGEVAWNGDSRVDLDLAWRDLRWPPTGGSPDWASPRGEGRLDGTLDDWRFSGAFDLAAAEYPPGDLEVSARGDREGATLESFRGEALGGALSGTARLSWSEVPSAEGDLQLETLDVGALLPEWPAVVDADLGFKGVLGEPVGVELDIRRLAGRLHGEALFGSGRLELDGERWTADGLRLSLGNASLDVDGSLGATTRGHVVLDVRRPGWVAESLGGEVTGELRIDTAEAFPLLAADLDASELALGDLRIDTLRLQRADSEAPRVELDATGVALGDSRMDRLAGVLAPDEAGYGLSLDAWAGVTHVHAQLTGDVEHGAGPMDLSWRGDLSALSLARDDRALLSLAEPAPLDLSRREFRLREACLDTLRGGALCSDVSGAPGERLELALQLHELPLVLLRDLAPHGVNTSQSLDGEAAWSWRRGASPSGSAAIHISAGTFGGEGDEDGLVSTGAGFIGFDLDAGNLENGRIDLPLANAGHVRADFTISEIRLDGTGRVAGQADLDLRDLGFLDSFVTQVDAIGGSLRSTLELGGTVADPRLNGGFDLSDGYFEVPALGATLEDLSLRGRLDGSDRLRLRGEFRAGAGEGRLNLDADFAELAAPTLEFRVNGDDLAVARLPDLDVDVSPDLTLAYGEGVWRLDGDIDIPRARVRPLTSFVSRVDESPDVIVVAGELEPAPATTQARPVELEGEIAVRLGDDVRLEMDIASLGLGGGVALNWDGDLVPSGTGEIIANGTVTAWGPSLTITDGRVRWAGGTVTNPSLDLQADRDVFGNTLVRTAGVRVSGTARRPDIEAFTRPLTTSERAWTVLVTGSDVNYAQGVGAVDVGAYIAPRVFLSYGISLFDSENVVGLRYDLRRGWGIKATSGQRESGVDLSYTIDRDGD